MAMLEGSGTETVVADALPLTLEVKALRVVPVIPTGGVTFENERSRESGLPTQKTEGRSS